MNELFTVNRVQRADSVPDWKEAIKLAAQPLIAESLTSEAYVKAVIDLCQEKGPYMNIGPEVVLAHARPISANKEAAVSLLLTGQSVDFVDNAHKARLWLFLATPDAESHIELIQKLAGVLMNASRLQEILNAESVDALWQLVKD